MARFQRRLALPLGVGMLLSAVGYLALADPSGWPSIVGAVLFCLAGVAFVLSSATDRLRIAGRTVSWQQANGAGTILLAVGWLLTAIPTVDSSPLFGIAAGVGALSLAFFGVQTLIDGPHVDLEREPARGRLVAVLALVIVSVGLGVAVAI
ncbi:hypothetical protein [Natronococcus jeotgali]|uniref:Integral membrane protein n=1 Tax=Natronococcus jeotgali DSM 18795 TaxID=1227498 RepID=L9XUF7_9EURY|nr:hypothetical protein [Natronococcus jeotgali]ELY65444.1 hypothetical protein C492_03986 [Natronococcus jeotgali DSM 18795]